MVRHPLPDAVMADNLQETLRLYHSMTPGHPDRTELRTRIVAYYEGAGEAALTSDDLEEATLQFARITDLLTPDDFAEGRVPAALLPWARRLVELASPAGDEARALSGYRTMLGDEEINAEYADLVAYGQEARQYLPNSMDRYSQLIEVWDEHARLTPAPEVLATLASLHVNRRDAVMSAFREGPSMMMAMGGLPTQIMRVAPLDVASVYLQRGDLASAITAVESMGDGGETEIRLLRVLNVARSGDDEGADALVEISEVYREARPLAARGICRLGLQRFPEDARFAACLARIATAENDTENATAWYARAIRLAPTVLGFYDEALEQLDQFLERGAFDQDAAAARSLARRAEHFLNERARRFPNAAPPIAPGRIQLLLGSAEMSAGNAEEAKRHLEASVAAQQTPEALEQLGVLNERLGEYESAVRSYRAALDLSTDAVPRAQLLEHLGDAFAGAENATQSARMYQQALDIWDEALGRLGDHPEAARLIGEVQLRRGILQGRLGNSVPSRDAFRAAMTAGSQSRAVYATILSYLVMTAEPDPEFAADVFRTAQRQLTLAPEWKVYFALWAKTVSSRAGRATAGDVDGLLRAHTETEGWSGYLARFGLGDMPLDELLERADGQGQQTEAHFYGGVDLLRRGDSDAAHAEFERAMTARMIGFYEYAMAQALLRL